MFIDNLIVEITRKCNLKCSHCLRGPAQRMTMSRQVMCAIASAVDDIGTLVITGGEPSLGVEALDEFLWLLRMRHIGINCFYVVSNGQRHNRYNKFLDILDGLYGWCDEQEACALVISQDQYHSKPTIDLWTASDYHPYIKPEERRKHIIEPINEGYAKINQLGWKEPEQQKPWKLHDYDSSVSVGEHEVYISANGNVTSCCDMSYRRIDREHKGNVLETSLSDIIESFSVKEEHEQAA